MKSILLVLISTFAFAKIAVERPVREKLKCIQRELDRRNCELRSEKLRITLQHGKWRYTDGVTTEVHDLPTGDAEVTWKSASLKLQGGRRLIELEAWAPPSGETDLQTLTWFVVEVLPGEPKVHVAEVIQRRRPKTARQPASYQSDPVERHGLRFTKAKFHWHAGRRQGEF